MRLFDNKLSRINFLILIGILTYLFANMSNEEPYGEAILKASPAVVNISSKKIMKASYLTIDLQVKL